MLRIFATATLAGAFLFAFAIAPAAFDRPAASGIFGAAQAGTTVKGSKSNTSERRPATTVKGTKSNTSD